MTIVLKPSKTSQGVQAPGTYGASAQAQVQYGVGYVVDTSTTQNLMCWVQYPTGVPAGTAIPAAVVYPSGGFGTTLDTTARDEWAYLVSCGVAVFVPNYRTAEDTPVNPDDDPGDSAYLKAARAAYHDERKFRRAMFKHDWRVTANYLIDPRRVIAIGSSSGGWMALKGAIEEPTRYAGVITCCGGIGLDAIGGATAVLRSFFTEADIALGTPPILSMQSSPDATIGTTWAEAMHTTLNADPANTCYLQNAGHVSPAGYGNVTYDGNSVTAPTACRLWMTDILDAVAARRPSKVGMG